MFNLIENSDHKNHSIKMNSHRPTCFDLKIVYAECVCYLIPVNESLLHALTRFISVMSNDVMLCCSFFVVVALLFLLIFDCLLF